MTNPLRTYNKIRGVFKPLKPFFYFTKVGFGPITYYHRTNARIGITSYDVLWKDKYNTPRLEENPYIIIKFFKWQLSIVWKLSKNEYMDDYWEQALWYLYYADSNLEKAKETWPWTYVKIPGDTSNKKEGESTWNDDYLI